MRALLAILAAVVSGPLHATTTTTQELSGASGVRGAFLARGMGARAVGMGDAFARFASNDPRAAFSDNRISLGVRVAEEWSFQPSPRAPGAAG